VNILLKKFDLILLFYRNLALIRRLDEQPIVWILIEIISTGYLIIFIIKFDE
jgi:hypothetical protein